MGRGNLWGKKRSYTDDNPRASYSDIGPDVFILALMPKLDPEIYTMTKEMLERAAKAAETHLFTALEDDGDIIAANLCACFTPLPTRRRA